MGRYYWSKKDEADTLKKIETWYLRKLDYLAKDCMRYGTLSWSNNWSGTKSSVDINVRTYDNPRLNISYKQTDSNGVSRHFDYDIPLTTTSCNLGGKRWWFHCPFSINGKYCGRRVGVLYKAGDYFACRHCQNLSYSSRNQNRRYKYFPLIETLTQGDKLEKLEATIKRKTYRGIPTRRYRRLLRLREQSFGSYSDEYTRNRSEALLLDQLYKT